MDKKDIKIFVTYKDKHKIIKSDIITPIQTGRAIADEKFEGMIGDDTGDNISAKNDLYAELTAQYWVWKHYEEVGDPEYVGFMHYRRHFVFNDEYHPKREADKLHLFGYSTYLFDSVDDSYLQDIGLEDGKINSLLNGGYDLICVKKSNARYLGCRNGKEDFTRNCFGSNSEDYDKCMDIVAKKFPEYKDSIIELNKGPYRYFYNMFIMSKNVFNDYSEFMFTILAELEKNIDTTYYSEKAKRVCGYMGEFLLSLYIFNAYRKGKLKIKELYSSFIKDTSECEILKPVFKDNSVAIAMSSSNEYAPYLSVCLESLKHCASADRNYDVIVFESNISQVNKKKLVQQVKTNNISLRFVNPYQIIKNYDLKFPSNYSLECYFRLTAPIILQNYEKVLFTDVDLIFNSDIYDLYNTQLGELPLAACKDLIWGAFIQTPYYDWKDYCNQVLKLKYPFEYFNTGVMVLNIQVFNENKYTDKLLKFVSNTQFRILEQDGLNAYFQNKIKYIDTAWNFPIANDLYNGLKQYMPLEFLSNYQKDEKNPKIIHWAGGMKPWHYPELDCAEIWWAYARKTPFYEIILKRMCDKDKPTVELLKDIKHYKSNVLKYWKYKILQNFVFGKTRTRYVNKKHIYKAKVAQGKIFK